MDLKRFTQLKSNTERLQREVSRAEGAHQELLKRLQVEFDCGSLKDAEKLLVQLRKDFAKIEKSYETSLADFEEKWGDVLELNR